MEQVTLYFSQGSSDKVYQASIEPKDGGFVVNFAFGRRGATLSTGTKTQKPVSQDQAKAILEKLITEKKAKGYSPGKDGTPYLHTDKESRSTGIHCQLLNSVEASEADRLINDPMWLMQEKWDGRRLLIQKQGDTIIGINRLGLSAGLPQTVAAAASNCPIDFVLDGEAVGDTLHVFDGSLIGKEDIHALPYGERFARTMNLLASFQHPGIQLVPAAVTREEKRALYYALKAKNAEDVVFKRADAPYTPGRPASGGSQLKYKFCETASFMVGSVNAKRSVSLLLSDGEKTVGAGNVTIPPNFEVPAAGQVVECRYLYAFKESGSVYQPVYLGSRDDIPADECVTSQLKFKGT